MFHFLRELLSLSSTLTLFASPPPSSSSLLSTTFGEIADLCCVTGPTCRRKRALGIPNVLRLILSQSSDGFGCLTLVPASLRLSTFSLCRPPSPSRPKVDHAHLKFVVFSSPHLLSDSSVFQQTPPFMGRRFYSETGSYVSVNRCGFLNQRIYDAMFSSAVAPATSPSPSPPSSSPVVVPPSKFCVPKSCGNTEPSINDQGRVRTKAEQRLRFGWVEVRLYECVLGSHPCTTEGLPVALGEAWRVLPRVPLLVDDTIKVRNAAGGPYRFPLCRR